MLRDRQPQESVEGSSQSEAVGGGGECGHSGSYCKMWTCDDLEVGEQLLNSIAICTASKHMQNVSSTYLLSHVCCTGKMSSNRVLCRRVELVSKGGVCQSAWPSIPMGTSSPLHIKNPNYIRARETDSIW